MKASRDCRELEEKAVGVGGRAGCPREMVSTSRRLPLSTFPSTLIRCKDGHRPARLENQVVPLCSGAVHGLTCGILDTFLLAQPKPLPSPHFSAPICHISATAACFESTGPRQALARANCPPLP